MAGEVKRCVVCGCELGDVRRNTKYCAECRKKVKVKQAIASQKSRRKVERAMKYARKNEEQRKAKEELRQKAKSKTLEQLALEARKAGMTYGQYIARKGIR